MENNFVISITKNGIVKSFSLLLDTIFIFIVVIGLSACNNKEKKMGQALASVNGEEITILQLNYELQRSNIQSEDEEARKKLLEVLIERQLILEEAKRNKIDRTPEVVKAIERAKMQIISEAYLSSISANQSKPTKIEIEEYYHRHPEYFAKRKQFEMTNLRLPTKSFNKEFKSALTSANSLGDAIAWMDKHNVHYVSNKVSRTSLDLSREMSEKLQNLQKGRLLILKDGLQTMIISLDSIRDLSITIKDASAEIEQYLINLKFDDLKSKKISHLKSLAKIEYFSANKLEKIIKTDPKNVMTEGDDH